MFEFVELAITINFVIALPILIAADTAGWEALFGEDEL